MIDQFPQIGLYFSQGLLSTEIQTPGGSRKIFKNDSNLNLKIICIFLKCGESGSKIKPVTSMQLGPGARIRNDSKRKKLRLSNTKVNSYSRVLTGDSNNQ